MSESQIEAHADALTDETIQPAQRQATEAAWRALAAAGHAVEPLTLDRKSVVWERV